MAFYKVGPKEIPGQQSVGPDEIAGGDADNGGLLKVHSNSFGDIENISISPIGENPSYLQNDGGGLFVNEGPEEQDFDQDDESDTDSDDPLDSSNTLSSMSGEGFGRTMSRAANLSAPDDGFEPSKIELPEVTGTVNTSWWKNPGIYSIGTALTGVGLVIAGITVIGLGVMGGAALIGSVAWGMGKLQSHRAAKRRMQQVQQALQSLEDKGVKFSREDQNRLLRLSAEDWEKLLKVPNINPTAHAVQEKEKEILAEALDLPLKIQEVETKIEVLVIQRSHYAQMQKNRPSEAESYRKTLEDIDTELEELGEQLSNLSEKCNPTPNPEIMSTAFDYRQLIRERAILNVAKNTRVQCENDVVTESTRRENADALMSEAGGLKHELISQARKGKLPQDPPLPDNAALPPQGRRDARASNAYNPFLENFQPLIGDEILNPFADMVPVNDQSDHANTENSPQSSEYKRAKTSLRKMFFWKKGKLTAKELTGVQSKSEIEQINRNLAKALIGGSLIVKGDLSDEEWIQKRKKAAEVVAKLAARNPKRFAALFETGKASSEKPERPNKEEVYQALHGVLYAMAEAGHTMGELEDAKHRLSSRVRGLTSHSQSIKLRKALSDVLDSVSSGEPVGKAMAVQLGYGYESGRRGWSHLNYSALQESKDFVRTGRQKTAVESAKSFPAHQEALVDAGLEQNSAACVLHWISNTLARWGDHAPVSAGMQPSPSIVAEKMKTLLALNNYASRSARYGHPHLDVDYPGQPDQRKDKIRAIVYALGTADPKNVVDAGGSSPLALIADELCNCSDDQLQDLLGQLNRPGSDRKSAFGEVRGMFETVFREQNRKREQDLFERRNAQNDDAENQIIHNALAEAGLI